jgi:hypothetical protein
MLPHLLQCFLEGDHLVGQLVHLDTAEGVVQDHLGRTDLVGELATLRVAIQAALQCLRRREGLLLQFGNGDLDDPHAGVAVVGLKVGIGQPDVQGRQGHSRGGGSLRNGRLLQESGDGFLSLGGLLAVPAARQIASIRMNMCECI